MEKQGKGTTENGRREKQAHGRLAVVAACVGVVVLTFVVVWFLLSGFLVGLGAGDDYYGDNGDGAGGAYGEEVDGAGAADGTGAADGVGSGAGNVGEADGVSDGQSDSPATEFPASTGWSASDRAGAGTGAPKQKTRSRKIVQLASQQIGNIGGRKFWSWYGYPGRVEWCACFVSWCADRCGYISGGVIPKFSAVVDGVAWFQERQQWHRRGYTPLPGDIIFFDWQQDGTCDHVGIVERTDGERIYTIEGNSLNMCRRKSYPASSPVIYGYGVPKI